MANWFVKLFPGNAEPEPKPKTSEPGAWRRAPEETISTDLGDGLMASMSYRTGHHWFVNVVGESHCQPALRELDVLFQTIGLSERTFVAKLVPEPNNPYDSNAVAVVTEGDSRIGYLSREVAKSYQKHLLRQSAPVTCPAKLTGGALEGKQSIGVVLDFENVRYLKL